MIATALLIAAWISAILGNAALALTNHSCQRMLTGAGERPTPARRAMPAGAALLTITLALAIIRDGVEMGAILGGLLIVSGSACVVALLTVRPNWFRMVAGVLH